jgi:hypothetical protein
LVLEHSVMIVPRAGRGRGWLSAGPSAEDSLRRVCKCRDACSRLSHLPGGHACVPVLIEPGLPGPLVIPLAAMSSRGNGITQNGRYTVHANVG